MTAPIRWTIILASGDWPLTDVYLRETFGGDRRKAERDAIRHAESLYQNRTFVVADAIRHF
jgi:hypothetical protein